MYVLTLKNRLNEFRTVQRLRELGLLDEGLLPLVEVVKKDVAFDKLVDPSTGEYVKVNKPYKSGKRKGQPRMCTVDDLETERDVTLDNISDAFAGKKVLVDFFRCYMPKYKGADPSKCKLVLKMSNDLAFYEEAVKRLADYRDLIPVISVIDELSNLSPKSLEALILELRKTSSNKPVAIRISTYEGYEHILSDLLGPDDYLIYDINETPPASRIEEFDELADLHIAAHSVLLCSPRKRDDGNKVYEDGCFIDNSHIRDFSEYGFEGVGDYAGLRDSLPPRPGAGATGRALALFYDGSSNTFKRYINPDVKKGQSGYDDVVKQILADRGELERRAGECAVLSEIADHAAAGNYGGWQTWIVYTVVRYVQQLYLAHGNSYNL